MKILFVSAEVAPYVSVGGLSQVMYFLPRALLERGHDVRIFTPKYGTMDKVLRTRKDLVFETDVLSLAVPVSHTGIDVTSSAESEIALAKHGREAIEFGGSAPMVEPDSPMDAGNVPPKDPDIICSVVRHMPKSGDAPAYFLVNDEYYGLRSNVFGYADDHLRFALLSKACLLWVLGQQRRVLAGDSKAWVPDVIHCHDWHTSYAIDLGRRDATFMAPLRHIPLTLTVHNFKFQGNADFRYTPPEDRDDGISPLARLTSQRLQKQNALLRGLLYADSITTVSPTHAREVLTSEFANGLEQALEKVRGKLSGIMNGIDVKEFNPATDAVIKKNYTRWTWPAGRKVNKLALQEEMGLPLDSNALLFGYVGRLSTQKGLELIIQALGVLLENRKDVQFVVVGGGEERYRGELEELRTRFPTQVALHLMPDFRLPRKVFAGADVMLMPSIFEPGGIVALEALRYGAVPLVRRTGGLSDSVKDFDPATRKGNGFSFERKDAMALYGSMVEALITFRQRALWEKLVTNCMDCDFSWKHAAASYEDWYERAVEEVGRATNKRLNPSSRFRA